MIIIDNDLIERQQRSLRKTLTESNLPAAQIDQVIAPGYFAWDIHDFSSTEGQPAIMDSYYGNKVAGFVQIEEFIQYLRDGTARRLRSGVSTFNVKNIVEVLSILSEPENARYAGRMSFRGQTTDYHIKRPVPNPSSVFLASSRRGSSRQNLGSECVVRHSYKAPQTLAACQSK